MAQKYFSLHFQEMIWLNQLMNEEICPEDLFAKITKLRDQFVIFTKLRGQIVIFQKSFLLCLFDCLFEKCDLIVFCICLNFVNSISFMQLFQNCGLTNLLCFELQLL